MTSLFKEVLNRDDGARPVNIGLQGGTVSPTQHLSTLGSKSFTETLSRLPAEHHVTEDKRHERHNQGVVKWSVERRVPDVGGQGWRTKTGHLLKNQAFYPQMPNVNKWDNPTFAGTNTWTAWHGPRLRTDAEMMERLDRFDDQRELALAQKAHVNTVRAQTLDRFYNNKLQREELMHAPGWAPHKRAKAEVHSSFETFDSTMDQKPAKELKKVFTEKVLKEDRNAMRAITKRLQQEETYIQVYKQLEQERREDLRADLQQRQAHTDRLMQLSGQPIITHKPPGEVHRSITNCQGRTEDLAKHKATYTSKRGITALSDFRGLVHADNDHALESLHPGSGQQLASEFCARISESAQPGWPPPARAETPPHGQGRRQEKQLQQSTSMSKFSIPSSEHRLQGIGTRSDPDLHKRHAKVQFARTKAPPPPGQSQQALEEDWSPKANSQDPLRLTGNFARTDHAQSPTSPKGKSSELSPAARRPYVYPVMVETSPKSETSNNGMRMQHGLHGSGSAPALLGASTRSSAGSGGLGRQAGGAGAVTAQLCEELDDFERDNAEKVPRVANFFGTPRATGSRKQLAF